MRTRILVPPGIGDIYWVLVKLRSFLHENGLSNPEITIVSDPDPLNSHLRGVEFIKMYRDRGSSLQLRLGDPQFVPNDRSLQPIWDEAYSSRGRSIFPGVMGYDFFMAYNGQINAGVNLEDADGYECDWSLPNIRRGVYPSPYMLCFFPFLGTYQSHEKDFHVNAIADIINEIACFYDYTPIFLGGMTEQIQDSKQKELIAHVPRSINLVGRTSLQKVLELVNVASLIFGYHSGIPNIAAAMGRPTVLLWDDRFPANTSYACVPPNARGTTYKALQTKNLTEYAINAAVAEVGVGGHLWV